MSNPEMSVVLVTPDSYRRLQNTITSLARQTVSLALELVIVSPRTLPDPQDPCWARFSAVKLVPAGPYLKLACPKAVAVSHCTAAIVAFAEDHCFPEPDWAENLIRCHADGWAAVAPALRNGNPGAVSWADCLLNFGAHVSPVAPGSVLSTPWHNTSYKRDLLNAYGERLEHMLEAEIRLHEDLVRNGRQLLLAANTVASHINISRWRPFLLGQLVGGRLCGSARAEAAGGSGLRRLLHASMLPLIPYWRAPQVIADARRTMRDGWNPAFLLACIAVSPQARLERSAGTFSELVQWAGAASPTSMIATATCAQLTENTSRRAIPPMHNVLGHHPHFNRLEWLRYWLATLSSMDSSWLVGHPSVN